MPPDKLKLIEPSFLPRHKAPIAFLLEMIVHHQGAVDMAKQAQKQAKHQEIIDLSQKIIDAQNSEIEMMKSWQKSWGY